MILEAHYKVYFTQSAANSFILTEFEVDLVYGKLQSECTVSKNFNLQTSVTFLESKESRLLSGNPGYLRGENVLVGRTEAITIAGASQGTSTRA